MSYAGWNLSCQRFDVHSLDEGGHTVEVIAVRPDAVARRSPAEATCPHAEGSGRTTPRYLDRASHPFGIVPPAPFERLLGRSL